MNKHIKRHVFYGAHVATQYGGMTAVTACLRRVVGPTRRSSTESII